MANIRVDLDYTIKDGSSVVFRSPCDCTEITGLIVYYITAEGEQTSKVFALADAHGNNVGDIPHLFASDVVVKVILDVTSSMAFVQNADTNAYIERTFVKTINKKAPDLSGNVEVETSGVYIGSDTPPESAKVWIDPNGEITCTEEWTFTLEDGTTETKAVVVVS